MRKEYLVLSVNNMSHGLGLDARKCAFWNDYLPTLQGTETRDALGSNRPTNF